MAPSGAVSPTKGVPAPNPTDDPAAKAAEDNTVQQNIIDELRAVREELSQMLGDDMKKMQSCPAVMTTLRPTETIEERDRHDRRRKLEEREAQLQKELKNYRLDPVMYPY